MVSCALFSVFNFLTIYVSSFPELVVLRFLTGIGLGGAVPTSLALVSEYFPKRRRGFALTATFSAFPLGGSVGGIIASYMVSAYGWQSIFVIGSWFVAVLFVPYLGSLLLPATRRSGLADDPEHAVYDTRFYRGMRRVIRLGDTGTLVGDQCHGAGVRGRAGRFQPRAAAILSVL